MPVKNFRLFHAGNATYLEIDGKGMGKGIKSVDFHHESGNSPILKLEIDLSWFEIMPDGEFEERQSELKK